MLAGRDGLEHAAMPIARRIAPSTVPGIRPTTGNYSMAMSASSSLAVARATRTDVKDWACWLHCGLPLRQCDGHNSASIRVDRERDHMAHAARRLLPLPIVLALFVLGGCAGSGGGTSAPAASNPQCADGATSFA